MDTTEATFDGTEGRVLYHRWAPDGPPARIVLVVHGYACLLYTSDAADDSVYV